MVCCFQEIIPGNKKGYVFVDSSAFCNECGIDYIILNGKLLPRSLETAFTNVLFSKAGFMHRLVLLRHGESIWNQQNRFTGWTDVDLSQKGIDEAHTAGRILNAEGFSFEIAFTSVLKRAIRTLWIVLDELDALWIPVYKSWCLNERHYGNLQGLNKAEMAVLHGEEQVHIWRRSFNVRPPALQPDSPFLPANDSKYRNLHIPLLPVGESLEDTIHRFIPYWLETIAPVVKTGQNVLVTAHGNSLRALVMHLESLSGEKVMELNIPTGIPLVYELDDALQPTNHYYLGDTTDVVASGTNPPKHG